MLEDVPEADPSNEELATKPFVTSVTTTDVKPLFWPNTPTEMNSNKKNSLSPIIVRRQTKVDFSLRSVSLFCEFIISFFSFKSLAVFILINIFYNCKYPLFQTFKTVDIGLLSTFSFHSIGVKFPKVSCGLL